MVNASAPMEVPKIHVRQITETDLDRVVKLLTIGFPQRGLSFWQHVMTELARRPIPDGLPRFGYLLEDGPTICGAILLIFSVRATGTQCNVSSWYVAPSHRSYASFLVAKALSRPGITYLNLTPAPHTHPIVEAQGYRRYCDGIFACVPALTRARTRARVWSVGPMAPGGTNPVEHELLKRHAAYGCISLWVTTPEGSYPFVFRPRKLKGVFGCAQLIYCRNLEDLIRFAGALGRHLLMRGKPLMIVDANKPLPGLAGAYFAGKAPRYFRGTHQPRIGDLADTEIAMFGV